MKLLKSKLGNSLVELTLAMAIAGVVSVPLSGIVAAQLRIPLKISAEVATASKIQSATTLLLNDAVSSRAFTPGIEPNYGTFEWIEFADDVPVAVSSRYFWQDKSLFRELTWDGMSSPPHLVKDDVEGFGEVVFRHTVSGWKIDPDTANWVYTGGRITVYLDASDETEAEEGEQVGHGVLVADFRPTFDHPSSFPSSLQ